MFYLHLTLDQAPTEDPEEVNKKNLFTNLNTLEKQMIWNLKPSLPSGSMSEIADNTYQRP